MLQKENNKSVPSQILCNGFVVVAFSLFLFDLKPVVNSLISHNPYDRAFNNIFEKRNFLCAARTLFTGHALLIGPVRLAT